MVKTHVPVVRHMRLERDNTTTNILHDPISDIFTIRQQFDDEEGIVHFSSEDFEHLFHSFFPV
ncbi:hypothetical protein [Bacillus pumilus]|uniref:hypothetical protein n=1 Tax=Bacillus pumilus TaxID=1408 RepID=UPI0007EEDE23|nr:hypothetical protein [Bacillus pumilus]OBS85778.1 hypothetical protein BAY68_19355 [Bacillus pumilus]